MGKLIPFPSGKVPRKQKKPETQDDIIKDLRKLFTDEEIAALKKGLDEENSDKG